MTETEAVLRLTQLLSMNLQTNTPAAVTVSPILVCFAQSKLPSKDSDLVQDIVSINPCNHPWNGIMALHRELLKNSEMTQMLAVRLSKE